jgi:hypothetical protein
LAIGTGIGIDLTMMLEFEQRADLAQGFAATALWREDLGEECPENDRQGENALSAVRASGGFGVELWADVLVKQIAQLVQRSRCGILEHRAGRAARDGEVWEERSGIEHSVITVYRYI